MRSQEPAAVVVNDDLPQLGLQTGLLARAGIEARAFDSAEAALAAMDPAAPPELIVTGLYMAGIDGWRFCRLLRSAEYAAFNAVPLLVVSNTFAGDHPEHVTADVGANAFLSAPFDAQEFVATAHALLAGQEARHLVRVLIADGDKDSAELLKQAFAARSYQATTALTAREAEAAFSRVPYDVAVLDDRLFDGTGGALLDALRTQRPECVCLVVTSDPTAELALDWMKRGAAAYLHKPFDPEQLLELCLRACRERALLRAEDLLQARAHELRESEERHRTLFMEMQEGFALHEIVCDASGRPCDYRYLEVNPAFERATGIPRERWIGHTVREVLPDVEDHWIQDFGKVALTGQASKFENYVRELDQHYEVVAYSPKRGQFAVVVLNVTERKRAEAELARARHRLEAASVAGRVALWELDLTSNRLEWSDAVDAMLGHASGTFERTLAAWLDVIHPEDRRRVEEALAAHLDHAAAYDVEYRVRRADGSWAWWRDTGTAQRDACGKPFTMAGACADVTDRRLAEEALRERQDMINTIVETSQDWIWAIDAHGIHTFSNPASQQILGRGLDEILGKANLDLLHEEDRALVQAMLPECVRARRGWATLLLRWRHKDGSYRYLESNAVPIVDATGTLTGFRGVDRDVTERHTAEEALRQERERLAGILRGTNAGTWEWNVQTGITVFNERWAEIVGYTLDEISPCSIETWTKLCHPNDLKVSGELLERHFRRELDYYECEARMRHKNGQWVWVLDRGRVVTWTEEGKPLMMMGTHQDITERKRAEEAREELQSQLLQAQKMESVGRLAGGVAHDFNNMLTAILGHVDLVLQDLSPESPLQENLTEIQNCARRSADLTRQLLAFARKQTIAPKVLDLNETIEGMLKMLGRLIGEDVVLAWKPGHGLWPVRLDPSQIDQILANLCVNARDAIAGVGKVTIETDNATIDEEYCAHVAGFVPGDYVRLAVSDNGCGMDAETLSHLFEPFFTTKEVGKGTGLGLATVYGAVKQNNGFVHVYSEPGQGTTFRIYLPRYAAKELSGAGPHKPQVAGHGNETILLVEDEPAILNLTRRVLERFGYTVLAARTPGEAIRLAREHPGRIDLLLTDVVMPEMNGRDLARNILALHPNIKRLFSSGYTANVIAHQGVLDPGVHFIQKPFSPQALGDKVREALED